MIVHFPYMKNGDVSSTPPIFYQVYPPMDADADAYMRSLEMRSPEVTKFLTGA